MPPKAETDPLIIEQRKIRTREKGRLRMQKHRSKGKELATSILGQALARVGGSTYAGMSIGENQALAQRTAQAILKGTLRRHGVTLERLVKAAVEALEATKLRRVGDEVTSQPDFGQRLRAVDQFLRLLERIGDIPDAKSRPQRPVKVSILMVGDGSQEPIATRLLEAYPEGAEGGE